MAAICDDCKKEGEDNSAMISLEIAAADGHPECLQAIINAGDDVNHINKENGYTPVMWAARYGHPECMELLIIAAADVNKTGCDDSALMFVSAYKGNIRCVELLLKAGADVNKEDGQGVTALMCAVRCGHPDIAKFLIKAGADVNATDKAGIAVITCCVTSTTGWKCVDLLVEEGADVNVKSYGKTALVWAVDNGYEECTEALVKAGADVNMTGEKYTCTALQVPAYRKGDKCFEILLNAGANVNTNHMPSSDVLMTCIGTGNYDRAERVIAAGADVNFEVQYGLFSTALFLAAVRSSPGTIRLLLRNGIKINKLNEYGNNALETYLSYRNTVRQKEVCMLLFAAGEKVTKVTIYTLHLNRTFAYRCDQCISVSDSVSVSAE